MALHSMRGLLSNHILFAALIAWFVAQGLKIPIYRIVEKKWDFGRFHGSGGMPSSHSSMVVAVLVMVGALEGFDSAAFAISFVLALIVMYDAAGVRRETGAQATVINQILRDLLINGKQITDDDLKELVGHTPLEVGCGALVGAIVGVLYLLCMFSN